MGVVDLGDGLTERPLTASDATTVFEVIADQELADLGVVEIEKADVVGDWQRPSFDVSGAVVGALGLYTKVGMEPTSVWVNRGIAL
jgi:hypothetical protein